MSAPCLVLLLVLTVAQLAGYGAWSALDGAGRVLYFCGRRRKQRWQKQRRQQQRRRQQAQLLRARALTAEESARIDGIYARQAQRLHLAATAVAQRERSGAESHRQDAWAAVEVLVEVVCRAASADAATSAGPAQ